MAIRTALLALLMTPMFVRACPDYVINEDFLLRILKKNIAGSPLNEPKIAITGEANCMVRMSANSPFGPASACANALHDDYRVGLSDFKVNVAGLSVPVAAGMVDIRSDIRMHCGKDMRIQALRREPRQLRVVLRAAE